MAVLKYKDENGNYLDIVGLNVQNEVVQTTGNSTTAVMSLKAVSDLIPAQASSSNQLADKNFVNSSITTATATYQGSYNLVSDLSLTTQASHGQIEQALNIAATGADNNDYSFVQIPTSDSTPTEIASVERYKYNGTTWSYEYAINNSGFTAAQWAAVNSSITSGLVAQLNAFSNNPQTSISKLFGMDANGNFQNISTSDLESVLGACVDYTTPPLSNGTPYNSNWTAGRGLWRLMPASYGKVSSSLVFTVKDDDSITFLSTTWYSPNLTIQIVDSKFVITQNFNPNPVWLTLTKIA